MSDIVERLRAYGPHNKRSAFRICDEAADEIERLQELLRSEGANRYWEDRWRDAEAELERLRALTRDMRNVFELFNWRDCGRRC